MQLLLHTILDIIRLKKGPEHVPHSIFVLIFAVGLAIFSLFAAEALMQQSPDGSVILSIVVSFFGYVIYWLVLFATGFKHRFLPTISCIIACHAVLTILTVAVFMLLKPVLGNAASVLAWLILMWAIPVKGHIIARAIEQHWYIGITIAFIVYLVQRISYEALTTYQVN